MGATQALLYLRLVSLRNGVAQFMRNWWRPRYLLGIAVIVGYLGMLLMIRLAPRRAPRADVGEGIEFLVSVAATLLLCIGWLFPMQVSGAGLRFSEAEAAFLFPAPVSRRQLIHYALLNSMLSALLQALPLVLLFTLLNPASTLVSFADLLLVCWMGYALYAFHGTVADLVHQRLQHRGRAAAWRVAVKIAVATFAAGCIALLVTGNFDLLRLLLPGRLLVHAAFVDGLAHLWWLLLMLLLLCLHYRWVLWLETPFEEAAMASAARHAAMLSGKSLREVRRDRRPAESFCLRDSHGVELLLLWKNLSRLPSYLNRYVAAGACLLILLATLLPPRLSTDNGEFVALQVGGALLSCLVMVVLAAPLVGGADLGLELSRADLMKSWPVAGWRIVLGTLLTPVVLVAIIAWLLLLGVRLSPVWPQLDMVEALSPTAADVLLIGTVAGLPLLMALELAISYAPQLCFPQWFKSGVGYKPGFDMLGLGILFSGAVGLVISLALLPPLLGALLMLYLGQWLDSQAAAVALALATANAVLLLEFLFVVHVLGERFERLDIVSELCQ